MQCYDRVLSLGFSKIIKALLLICCLQISILCSADEPENLDLRKIIDGDSLERPIGEDLELLDKVKTFSEFDGKRVLAFIRQGDYAHAGEEEAIDLIMSFFPKEQNLKILDVACGLGGTADYIRKHGWGELTGFDIDEEAINYAKKTYPQVNFLIADVVNASEVIKSPNFDLICIVNSLACFPDQFQSLKQLRKLANPSTQLLIFDYTDLTKDNNNPLKVRGRGTCFSPLKPKEFEIIANSAGWQITKFITLDDAFELWYKKFLDRVESKRKEIDEKFGRNATNYVRGLYDLIYYACINKSLGGCLIILSTK